MATLKIPNQLATYTDGKNVFELNASRLSDALDGFIQEHKLAEVFYNAEGALNQFIRVFVDKKLVQQSRLEELNSIALEADSQILIQTAFSGG